MKKFILILLLFFFCAGHSTMAQERGAVFVFFNPFKLFIGLINIGVEYQINQDHSVYLNAEKIFFRSDYLQRINHPDIVITPGYRFYAPIEGKNGSRPFAGTSVSMVYHKAGENSMSRLGWWLGGELGYRWLPDESTTIAPRGLVNYNLSSKKFIFGAEVLAGKSFQ